MVADITTKQIDLREEVIRKFPCFTYLSIQQARELAAMMTLCEFKLGDKIVGENELIDSIYFLVKGEAEVTREVKEKKKIINVPVAILRTGEAIGLNDTGFYSTTGKRTATVTALTSMRVLRLDLKDLDAFLEQHHLENNMYAASQQMLRMKLIKQSLPFSKVSHERLRWLADRVEELNVPAGKVLFHQGDEGDKCYLIRSGVIEIFSIDETKQEKRLALLKPPVLFGEATLITSHVRNASARALEDCELLVLSHQHLSELLESENKVAKMFMSLMVDRSRPLQNNKVSVHHRLSADGQKITILKNAGNNSYLKLSEEGFFIWQQLDGQHTMQDITLSLVERYKIFAPEVVAGLISKLGKAGFIKNMNNSVTIKSDAPIWAKAIGSLRNILEKRVAFGDADQWITHFYNKYVRYLFTLPGIVLLLFTAIYGFLAFMFKTDNVLIFFSMEHANLLLLLALIPFSLIELSLHELGHAFAVKKFGHEVHYIGIGWYWFGPIAFTDTSDMWLAGRKPRILVNLAGIFVDVFIAGIASLLILVFSNPYVQGLLWLFALYTYIGAFRMLSPLQEMDGYYALMDWVEKNKLRQSSVLWLIKIFPQAFRNPKLFLQSKAEIIYWFSCIIFLVLVTLITYVVQNFVLTILGIHANKYTSFILPFLVVAFSCLSIVADIRNQKEE